MSFQVLKAAVDQTMVFLWLFALGVVKCSEASKEHLGSIFGVTEFNQVSAKHLTTTWYITIGKIQILKGLSVAYPSLPNRWGLRMMHTPESKHHLGL
jgi:hypothetical protein